MKHDEHATREPYRFGSFELDGSCWTLRHDGRELSVAKRPLRILAHLIEHRERAVTHEELLAVVWPNVRVASGSVYEAVRQLRKVLHEHGGIHTIKTVHGRGYRFVGVQLIKTDRDVRAALHRRLELLSTPDLRTVLNLVDHLARQRTPSAEI